jgi:replicative DNA helicase
MDVTLVNFSARVGRKKIVNQKLGNENLHKITNDNVSTVNLDNSRSAIVKNPMFTQIATFVNVIAHLQIERHAVISTIF